MFTPSASPEPPRVLTICMGREPDSLFLYGDSSAAARTIREAIYDGPLDILEYQVFPVILEKVPALADGDALFEPVQVLPGTLIADSHGNRVVLEAGTRYLPSECHEPGCAQEYSGQEPVTMDQMVVRFSLRQGLLWSDGAPLTAGDSVYSFEVANRLSPQGRLSLLEETDSYQALDDHTVEWRGLPGVRRAGYRANFFTPLPRHAWESLPVQELLSAESSTRQPLGWGPFIIEEWTSGDHITLSRNPNYFRAAEGLPYFDRLVFHFPLDRSAALEALLAGECDLVDKTAGLEGELQRLMQLQEAGEVAVEFEAGSAWEHADFGIHSLDGSRPALFQTREVRQAVAACLDRERLVAELFAGKSSVPDTFVPPAHPLFNEAARRYPFNPQEAANQLQAAGWMDVDGDPSTPRVAQGVPNVPAGTPFEFTYLTTDDAEHQRAAQILQESLALCGIRANVNSLPAEELFAPGPEGPVFGRRFDMAQFAWTAALEPPCFLYTTPEIPGPYPEFPKAWGGANASGFANPDFDQACARGRAALPETAEYQEAHRQAQAIFTEELPAIPLYSLLKLLAFRPGLCGVQVDPSAASALWNLELFNDDEGCQ